MTGLWTEEETEIKDKDGNVTATVVTRYDIQSGYYVREETDAEGTTAVNRYAKEGGKYYLVQTPQDSSEGSGESATTTEAGDGSED